MTSSPRTTTLSGEYRVLHGGPDPPGTVNELGPLRCDGGSGERSQSLDQKISPASATARVWLLESPSELNMKPGAPEPTAT